MRGSDEIGFSPQGEKTVSSLSQEGALTLLFTTREIDALRLISLCRYVKEADLADCVSADTVETLFFLKLIKRHKASGAIVLRAEGKAILKQAGYDCGDKPITYHGTAIERRLRASRFILTAYKAGLSSPDFHLTMNDRIRGSNPWGSSRTIALVRLGDTIYGVHYVCPGIGKISLTDELAALSNNTAQLDNEKLGLIFTGESCADILSELDSNADSGDSRLITYGEAYRAVTLPVHIVPANDTGAKQLRIMSQPDYLKRLTLASLKSAYQPPPDGFSEFDATYKGSPFVMAVDLNLRRVDAAIEKVNAAGLGTVTVVSTIGQANEVIRDRYGKTARVLTLKDSILGTDGELKLNEPPNTQFLTPKGDVIDAPLIQAHRKA